MNNNDEIKLNLEIKNLELANSKLERETRSIIKKNQNYLLKVALVTLVVGAVVVVGFTKLLL